MNQKFEHAIQVIAEEYKTCTSPWVLGYSGGKDSTALLKALYGALLSVDRYHKQIDLIYCNTGVEFPIINDFVLNQLHSLQTELAQNKLPIRINILKPPIHDSFFTKIIGRGYPPPTNKFRWCTDRLRIRPIKKFMTHSDYTALVGVRKGESQERDRILERNKTDKKYYYNQSEYSETIKIFAPLVDFSVEDIWNLVLSDTKLSSISGENLYIIYQKANKNIENIRNLSYDVLKEGRFGCWCCTVIRKDRAMENLINNGHSEYIPLYNFRNWLISIRENENYRCKYRRNGTPGKGPFTLSARKEILRKLRYAERKSRISLLSKEECKQIKILWRQDELSKKYTE